MRTDIKTMKNLNKKLNKNKFEDFNAEITLLTTKER